MTERRTLEIVTKVVDQLSKPFGVIRKTIVSTFQAATTRANAFKNKMLELTGLKGIFAGLVAGLAVRQLVSHFAALTEELDQVSKAATKLGATGSSLYTIRNLAEENAVKFETLVNGLRDFSKNAGYANRGSKEMANAFAKLGISTEDLAGDNKDLVDLLARTADALAGIENQADKTAVVMQVFGRGGLELLPVLEQGGAAIRKYEQDLRAMGLTISDEQLKTFDAYKSSLDKLSTVFKGLSRLVVIELAPALTDVFDALRKAMLENAPEIRKSMLGVVDAMVLGIEALAKVAKLGTDVYRGWQLIWISGERTIATFQGNKEKAEELGQALVELTEQQRQADKTTAAMGKAFDELRERMQALRENAQQPIKGPTVQVVAEPPDDLTLYWANFQEGAEQATEAWRDFSQAGRNAGRQVVEGGLSAVSDAFADIITQQKSAKDAWKDFASTVLQLIGKIIARLITMQILSAFGYEGGGVHPGELEDTRPVRKFAHGGIARGPTMALFGEGSASKGEAFVPLPDGRRIPVEQLGGGGTNYNVNITAMDSRDVQRAFYEQRGLFRAMQARDLTRVRSVRQRVKGASR